MKTCLFLVVLVVFMAVASAQHQFRPFKSFSASRGSSDGSGAYKPDNSGAYKNDDGRYHGDSSGQYVHSADKYNHLEDRYKHQKDKFGNDGGNTGGQGGFDQGGNYHGSGNNGQNGNTGGFVALLPSLSPTLGSGGLSGAAFGSSGNPHKKPAKRPTHSGSGFGSGFGSTSGQGVSGHTGHNSGTPFAGAVVGSASGKYDNRNYAILKKIETVKQDGYHYLYETENGITGEEQGKLANVGTDEEAMKAHGFYTYTGPDNIVYTVRYTADENGFVPEGAHIPTPPPIPAAILRALEYQRSVGTL